MQELYRCREDGSGEQQLTHFNDEFLASRTVAPLHYLPFTDSDGVQLDGWVIEPVGYDPSKRYPAILDVHGGPKTVYGEVFFHEMQLWASEGYFVFFCNPRGGDGRGNEFADIRGKRYGVWDYNDLMEFTDHVLQSYPQIDPARVGMTGGSYGGFMANWIVGHTDRFAAVASQRSIANFISKCLTTDIGYYHNLCAVQSDPWNSPEEMWNRSPLKYADKCTTPTLFIQSDEDYRCWMADALQMFTALRMHGVPTRVCLFHGENHELSRNGKPKHRVRRLKEITRWFDRYLKTAKKRGGANGIYHPSVFCARPARLPCHRTGSGALQPLPCGCAGLLHHHPRRIHRRLCRRQTGRHRQADGAVRQQRPAGAAAGASAVPAAGRRNCHLPPLF